MCIFKKEGLLKQKKSCLIALCEIFLTIQFIILRGLIMENANVVFFTDNDEGEKLAAVIESLGFTVKKVSSLGDRAILNNCRDNYILIFDITGEDPLSVLSYADSIEGGDCRVKYFIMDQLKMEKGHVKSANLAQVEFIAKPVDNREFLLLLEKTILLEKYRNLMAAISRESWARMEIFETVFGPNRRDSFDEKAEKEAFVKMIDFEKKLMEEQLHLNDAIRRIALMRNRDYLALKERVEAEEMLDELRKSELHDANRVIQAQEALIDYSTKELYVAKKIIDASENVAELSRVEALELHNELSSLKEQNSGLLEKISLLMKENIELKKSH